MAPVTTGEFRELFDNIGREFRRLHFDIEQVKLVSTIPCSHPHVESQTASHPQYLPSLSQQNPAPLNLVAYNQPPLHTSSSQQPAPCLDPFALQKTKKRTRSVPPFPHVSIRKIPHGPDAWREAVQQWEKPNPTTGLIPLKDWPSEWYSGGMSRFTGSLWHQRKVVSEEFYRYVRTTKSINPFKFSNHRLIIS